MSIGELSQAEAAEARRVKVAVYYLTGVDISTKLAREIYDYLEGTTVIPTWLQNWRSIHQEGKEG